MRGFFGRVDRFFMISERGSSFRVEFFAGVATFLAMAYILVVNPDMILGGAESPRWTAVFIATVLGAVTGTVFMAFMAKLPYAQGSGMGLNTVTGGIIGGYGAYHYNFNTAMLIVLLAGLVFVALSVIPCGRNARTGKLIPLREKVFDGVPKCVRIAIPVGIGLFVAFVGFQKANIVVGNAFTLTEFVHFTDWSHPEVVKNAIICFFGLILISVLSAFRFRGSVIIGIIASTILAIILGMVDFATLKGQNGVSWKFWENFANYFSFSESGAFLAPFYSVEIAGGVWPFLMMVLTFSMIDLFDTMGTVVGCAQNAGLIDDDGKPLSYSDIMHADSITTVFGAMFGTSTITTYVESAEGVVRGGRTGFTALVVAGFFLLSLFFAPLFAFIPPAATAPALIYVGLHMIGSVKNIDFHDIKNAIPAFLAIVIMPLGFAITEGIGVAILSYVLIGSACYLIELIQFKAKKTTQKPKWNISLVTLIIALLFCIFFFVPS